MPEIGTSSSMSEDGKRSDCRRAQATAPILDSTDSAVLRFLLDVRLLGEAAVATTSEHGGLWPSQSGYDTART